MGEKASNFDAEVEKGRSASSGWRDWAKLASLVVPIIAGGVLLVGVFGGLADWLAGRSGGESLWECMADWSVGMLASVVGSVGVFVGLALAVVLSVFVGVVLVDVGEKVVEERLIGGAMGEGESDFEGRRSRGGDRDGRKG